MTRDPYLALAIEAYRREKRHGVTMRKVARMLGIGEKSFSRIVRNVSKAPCKPWPGR